MNKLIDNWLNSQFVDRSYIPCSICGEPTNATGTRLCNVCWLLMGRLRSFLSNKNAIDFVESELKEAKERLIEPEQP